ncbi:MAG TPA: DoxX family protein [Steroidobacteraceae bacterium]
MNKRGRMWWLGWSMSALVVLFLLLDSGMKLAAVRPVLEAGMQIGFPGEAMARKLGLLLLICTALYVWPATSVLGAILVTGFLGGAVATHVRLGNPLFSHVLFGVYVGVLMWGGLFLREERVRALLPVLKPVSAG